MHRHTTAVERPLRPATRRRPEVAPHILALLHQAQQGDRDAFAALYLTYREPVTRYVAVRLRGRDRDLIADLVQETFTNALADLGSALADVRGWLIWQAAKACNQHDWSRRRYLRAAYAVREDADRSPAAQVTAEPAPTRLGRLPFVHAMARLTPDQRRAIQLRYLDGYPRDAAARLMGRSVWAVGDLERRALRRMQITLTTPPVTA
ncbi:sigma-70 family RNA polymerase sigma factor [Micromonospora sp. WMMD718]|uniref:RNA polymerase sigma factor n=1 Tax=Micromonospora TaxID=1873 RepID=UPI00064C0438|nr:MULTISPECIES: sigma-70 family RNA polymerase sigma factor [unclassified Micromonospora]MDG4751321.1 sigma-70 family RNA polymerase sigma factor [Micromonospora sp. WMMD718]